ncbi:MAG: helix-turn-helix domain-containing protein [Candidatus Peregrinibacteria bacterium]|nr:helix-turn-helix domain-containing protein [Candidatus Peregrinibacteria bacterium]
MLEEVLKRINLDEKEIEVYLRLLKYGPNRASTLAYQIGLPRTTTQNILLRLERDEMLTKSLDKNVAIYAPINPEELVELLDMKRRRQDNEMKEAMKELKMVMPELLGMMHSNKHIPSVKFYRGMDAVRKVFFDTLKSKTELKDFANIDAMFEHVKDINDEYVKEREKTKITKRSLLLDTPFAREVYESGGYSPTSHKGYKWIKQNPYFFSLEMNIYDGKVSYLTYVEEEITGVIIQNDTIYQMHDSMWNLIWDMLPE